MSTSSVVIAITSGGFVAAVLKAAQERTAWFRGQMIQAADQFLAASADNREALDEAFRSVALLGPAFERVRSAADQLGEQIKEIEGAESGAAFWTPAADRIAQQYARAVGRVHSELFSDRADARERVDAVLSDMTGYGDQLLAIEGVSEAVVSGVEESRSSIAHLASRAADLRDRARTVRGIEARLHHALTRLSLLYAGRFGGDSVLSEADRVVSHLSSLRAIVSDSIDDETDPSDDPATAAALNSLDRSVELFAVAANRAVRRSVL